jgi:hypothetical protein
MKPIKKLTLSKETLAILTDGQTKMVGGGVATTPNTNGNICSTPCNTDACGGQPKPGASAACVVSQATNCSSSDYLCY